MSTLRQKAQQFRDTSIKAALDTIDEMDDAFWAEHRAFLTTFLATLRRRASRLNQSGRQKQGAREILMYVSRWAGAPTPQKHRDWTGGSSLTQ